MTNTSPSMSRTITALDQRNKWSDKAVNGSEDAIPRAFKFPQANNLRPSTSYPKATIEGRSKLPFGVLQNLHNTQPSPR